MTIYLPVCLLAGLCNYYWSDHHEKKMKRWDSVQLRSRKHFERNTEQCLGYKQKITKIRSFPFAYYYL